MNILDFKAKWSQAALKESAAAHEHFIDLCQVLGFDTPAQADPAGTRYTFERGVSKTGGGQGFADVWYRDHFAWEYKGQRANLEAAYAQLKLYIDDLENPPLLVVCDLDRFEVHTNFTGTVKQIYRFDLAAIDQPESLRVLRALWQDPYSLRPQRTIDDVTKEAAECFGRLARGLQDRGVDPERAAHFLVQILFSLFAEDVGLLPKGLFGQLLDHGRRYPEAFPRQIEQLFTAMRDGGDAGFQRIDHFNGGLFAEIDVVPLTKAELDGLWDTAQLDWTNIEPAIIGTLFERSLDPARRS